MMGLFVELLIDAIVTGVFTSKNPWVRLLAYVILVLCLVALIAALGAWLSR